MQFSLFNIALPALKGVKHFSIVCPSVPTARELPSALPQRAHLCAGLSAGPGTGPCGGVIFGNFAYPAG
ncbi:UNVERIFIED_CONTAM: hypothetical protein FKN15_017086 [Acipenser sinensis]